MKVSISKRHLPFSLAYFITMLTLLLNQFDALPAPLILRKTKYLYIFFVCILILSSKKIKRKCGVSFFVIILFFIHTILFGYIFTNPIAVENISSNANQMMWYLLFVFVTYLYISQNDKFELFINLSFYVTGLQLFIAGLLHYSDFVNPIWGLKQTFTEGVRYKTCFGFVHPGYLSNACFLVIVLSIFFYEINRFYQGKRKIIIWGSLLVIDALAIEMLMSAAQRSGIITSFFTTFFYFIFVIFRIRVERKTIFFFVVLFFLITAIMEATGVFTYIWSNSNRELNITVNYPVFQQIGNLWTGMGYVDNSGFHEEIAAFGIKTSSLDMYYVYIFFTTGIVGCILIGTALIIMLIRLLMQKKTNLHIAAIGLYIGMLFFAFWQCNMVTYRYVSPTILFLIVLFGMSDDFCMQKKMSIYMET